MPVCGVSLLVTAGSIGCIGTVPHGSVNLAQSISEDVPTLPTCGQLTPTTVPLKLRGAQPLENCMRSIRNRSLTTLLILLGSISVVNAQSQSTISASSGWTFVQDSPVIFCAGNISSCSNFSGTITPTVAGSVWILEVQVPSHGVTITNVTGGGGTWTHCPKCHVDNPNGFDADAWYNLGGNAGTAGGISFTLSGNSGAFISVNFVELLPPAGTTAFYDDSGTAIRSGCSGKSSTPCLAVGGLNITATDVVWQNPGGAGQAAWNSWSFP